MALPTYQTGTVSVAAGGTVVTGVGVMWSGINAKQGDFISIGGSDAVLITEVTDSTHLKIPPWAGAAASGAPYVIYRNYVGRVVGVAAAEDVGDMLEMLHVNGLPFIVDPAETVPDPSYGDDGQMAFKPSTGQWWTKTGGAWVSSPGLTSDASKVLKTGDTMTGNLVITSPAGDPGLSLNKIAGAHANLIRGQVAGLPRWVILIGDYSTETGGNVGSDFRLYRYNDAGAFVDPVLTIARSSGLATIKGDPTANLGIATKQYVDARTNNQFARVALSVAQSGVASGIEVLVNYDGASFDPSGIWNNTTKRFVPTVAGFYAVSAAANLQMGGVGATLIRIRKNGIVQSSGSYPGPAVAEAIVTAYDIVHVNGSTDYIDFSVYMSGVATRLIAASSGTFATIHLVKAD